MTVSCAGPDVAADLIERALGVAAREHYSSTDRVFPLRSSGRYYSVSHTEDFTALALAPSPVGIDVETRISVDLAEDMAWALTDDELAELTGDGHSRLTEIWTTKEAAGKALGVGLAARPDCFDTHPIDGHGIDRISRVALPVCEEVQIQTTGWWVGNRHLRIAWHDHVRPSGAGEAKRVPHSRPLQLL